VINRLRPIGLLLAVFALAALPAATQASRGKTPSADWCAKHGTVKRAFTVRGKLGSFSGTDKKGTADSIEIVVSSANRHARHSGDIDDQDPVKPGVQVKGATYSVSGDTFKYRRVGYEPSEASEEGDKAKLVGKIEYTKKRCAPEGTSLEDRYGDVNIRKVLVKDKD
jgi:hypothetical protein